MADSPDLPPGSQPLTDEELDQFVDTLIDRAVAAEGRLATSEAEREAAEVMAGEERAQANEAYRRRDAAEAERERYRVALERIAVDVNPTTDTGVCGPYICQGIGPGNHGNDCPRCLARVALAASPVSDTDPSYGDVVSAPDGQHMNAITDHSSDTDRQGEDKCEYCGADTTEAVEANERAHQEIARYRAFVSWLEGVCVDDGECWDGGSYLTDVIRPAIERLRNDLAPSDRQGEG